MMFLPCSYSNLEHLVNHIMLQDALHTISTWLSSFWLMHWMNQSFSSHLKVQRIWSGHSVPPLQRTCNQFILTSYSRVLSGFWCLFPLWSNCQTIYRATAWKFLFSSRPLIWNKPQAVLKCTVSLTKNPTQWSYDSRGTYLGHWRTFPLFFRVWESLQPRTNKENVRFTIYNCTGESLTVVLKTRICEIYQHVHAINFNSKILQARISICGWRKWKTRAGLIFRRQFKKRKRIIYWSVDVSELSFQQMRYKCTAFWQEHNIWYFAKRQARSFLSQKDSSMKVNVQVYLKDYLEETVRTQIHETLASHHSGRQIIT